MRRRLVRSLCSAHHTNHAKYSHKFNREYSTRNHPLEWAVMSKYFINSMKNRLCYSWWLDKMCGERRKKNELGEEYCWHKEWVDNIKIHYSSQFISTIHTFFVRNCAKIILNMNIIKRNYSGKCHTSTIITHDKKRKTTEKKLVNQIEMGKKCSNRKMQDTRKKKERNEVCDLANGE